MNELERDDEYVALLRGRLPDAADKARMQKRLAALGVGGGATLVAASAQAVAGKAAATTWKLTAVSKAFLAAGSVAVLGSSLYLAASPSPRAEANVGPARVVERAPKPAMSEPLVEPLAAPEPIVEKARKVRSAKRPAPDTLNSENALLGAAVRALNAGETAEAERLLDEHARRHPNGVLRDERERARRKLGPHP
jgi:hypothetical protein